jgi:hypothetical protein
MKSLNDLVIRVSESAWLFLFSAVFAFGSLVFVFFNINDVFEVMVAAQMFDFQNDLTVEKIFEQLPNYSYAARKLYYAFLFVDYFFPFFAGLVLAAVAAFALRHLSTDWYDWINTRNLFVVMFAGTFCDWLENTCALVVVMGYPEEFRLAANLLVFAKMGKLASIAIFQGATLILLAFAAGKWIGTKTGLIKS